MKKTIKRLLACALAVVMVLCAVPLSGDLLTVGAVSIPSDAVEFNGHYYKVYDQSLSWSDSAIECEKLGGHLVTITSEAENNFVFGEINKYKKKEYWIGCYREDRELHWVTGETFDYHKLSESELNADYPYIWIQIFSINCGYPSEEGTWDDMAEWQGYSYNGFVCEWDVPVKVLTSLTAFNGKDQITYSGEKQYSAKEIELSCEIFNRVESSSKKKYDTSLLIGYDCSFNKVSLKLPDTDILYFKKGLNKDCELNCNFDKPIKLQVGESAEISTSNAQALTTYKFVNEDFKLFVNPSYSWGANESKKVVPIEVCVYNGDTLVSSCTKKITFINPSTEKATQSKENAEKAAKNAASILDNTACAFNNQFLNQIFTKDQLLAIQCALQCKIAISAVPVSSYKSAGLSDKIIEKILSKAGVKRDWLGNAYTADIQISVSVDSEYGPLEILFSAPTTYYSFGSDNPYAGASFNLSYEVTGGKGKKNVPKANLSNDNIGYIGFASISNFTSSVKSVVMSELEAAFNLGYGDDYNKVCGCIFGDTFTEIISRTNLKSYSHMTWEAITFPSKQVSVRCPVDVYVYDAEGKQCAAVVDNEISQECEDMDIHVNGDEKYFTVYEGDYSFECIATANGQMTITVDEYANKNDIIRSVEFDNIVLDIGESYKAEITEDILDEEYQVVKSDDSVIMPDFDVVNIHQPQIVEVVETPATCVAEGQAHTECLVCGEAIDTYTISATGHTDTDHDGNCDTCGETLDAVKNCTHICHKTGFAGFIWKILRVFCKLFGIYKYCECGVKHY
ncbi:MAG: lectin-like protein [Acutalibacteraceae bacterium]